MKKIISTDLAPQAIGPYSQAIFANNVLYTSGQIAINPATGLIEEEGIEGQTKRVLENLRGILESVDMKFPDVVKTTVFIKNMQDFAKVNAVYSEYFRDNAPARSCVEVSCLPKNALIEIEVIAQK